MSQNARLIQKAWSSGWLLLLIVVFGFLAGGLIIWQSWLLSGVISKVFLEKQFLAQVVPILRLILLLVGGRAIFILLNETLAGRLAVRVKIKLRDELLEKINRLGPSFLKGEQSGELTTTVLQGLDALDAYFSQYLPQILLAALLPLTILIVVIPVDLLTGIVFLVTAPMIPFFMVWIGKLSQNHTQRQWTALSRLGAYFLDTLQGLSTLMILGRSRERVKEVREVSDHYRSMTMNVLKITFLSAFVLELVSTISTALVAVEIGLRLLYSQMGFQQAFFILLIVPEFYLPLRNLSMRYHAGMSGLTAANRIFKLLDTPEKCSCNPVNRLHANPFEKTFQIKFKDVSFRYPDNEVFALEHINLEIESGKRYALVGESGAGKTTLCHLLLRFMPPENGQILLNGVDIQSWELEEWRRKIAWIPQHPALFNTSLFENIRLHNPDISRSEVEIALQKASLESFVISQPMGLETQLRERGSRLSGGEARRVALARAYARNASLLLMDEPTAHLDIELERTLAEAAAKLQTGRLSITIAHRLSTVVSADTIFVLRHGHLVEQGDHSTLLANHGEYERLTNASRRST